MTRHGRELGRTYAVACLQNTHGLELWPEELLHRHASLMLKHAPLVLGYDQLLSGDSLDKLLLRLNGILGASGTVELYVRSGGNVYLLRRIFQPNFSADGKQLVGCTEAPQHYRFDAADGTLHPADNFKFPVEVYEQNRIYRLRDDITRQLEMLDEFADLGDLNREQASIVKQLDDSAAALAPLYEERERLT